MADISGRDFVLSTVSLAVGALIAAFAAKLQNRTAKLTYSTRVERVALAADDPVFGAVRVSWRDMNVRNLHMATIEIENSSGRDFENVDLKTYTHQETVLLNEFTSVVGTPYIVEWSPGFRASLAVASGAEATDEQLRIYNHSREYRVPVFNRGQVLRFNYLCTRPGDDTWPFVYMSTQLKGGKLVQQIRTNIVLGGASGRRAWFGALGAGRHCVRALRQKCVDRQFHLHVCRPLGSDNRRAPIQGRAMAEKSALRVERGAGEEEDRPFAIRGVAADSVETSCPPNCWCVRRSWCS
jgi:hypothetical protein